MPSRPRVGQRPPNRLTMRNSLARDRSPREDNSLPRDRSLREDNSLPRDRNHREDSSLPRKQGPTRSLPRKRSRKSLKVSLKVSKTAIMAKKNNCFAIVVLLVMVSMAVGCSRKTIYSHYEPTPLEGWEKNDTLSFRVMLIRSDGSYKEEIGLRTSGAYPFTGLTLVVEQRSVPSGMMRSDTLHARLVSRDGTVQGKGIVYYQYKFHLANLRLNEADTLYVSIRHNMKREILPGISDVGLILQRLDE